MATVTHSGVLPDSADKADFYAIIDNATVTSIANADIAAGAAIVDTKLAQLTTANKVHSSAVTDASTTLQGVVELATSAEINAGTDTDRAIGPDEFVASIFGRKTVVISVIDVADAVAAGDGKKYFRVPVDLNGMNLVAVAANVYTASTSGAVTVSIERGRRSAANGALSYVDMLSTNITIDQDEFDSANAATAAVVNTSNDDVVCSTYVDMIRVNVDDDGTDTKGLDVTLVFQLP